MQDECSRREVKCHRPGNERPEDIGRSGPWSAELCENGSTGGQNRNTRIQGDEDGLSISGICWSFDQFAVNEDTIVGGYAWKDITQNVKGLTMALMAVGVICILLSPDLDDGTEDSKRRRKSRWGASSRLLILRMAKRKKVEMFTAWLAVCLGTAFLTNVLRKTDIRTKLRSIGSFVMFGSADPYMTPLKSKKVGKEMRDAIKEILN
ncbi:MAG: hypothetical protein VCF07_07705 [Nitrospinota bacterium]